jgi:WxL domain surface cell wall-binding
LSNGRLRRARVLRAAVPIALIAGVVAITASVAGASGVTGTATITAGSLSITPPTALGWSTTLNGADQEVVDTTTADQSMIVNDPTGSGNGWHASASATAFTCSTSGTCGTSTLGASAFSVNGSTSDHTAITAPAVACSSGAPGCTVAVPDGSISFPVTVGTTATPIFNAEANTGMGSNTISSIGWWLAIPANTKAGTYTSTVTLAVSSGP